MTNTTSLFVRKNCKIMADAEESHIVTSPPMEPDSSESAPLLQEQENQNEDPGPPPPFVASKSVKRKN